MADRPIDLPVPVTAEAATYRARARRLGLPFVSHVRLGSRSALRPDDDIEDGRSARNVAGDLIIAPPEEAMAEVAAWLRTRGRHRRRVSVATPTSIRAGIRESMSRQHQRAAEARVETVDPDCSARRTLTARQAGAFVLVAAAVAAGLVLWTRPTLVFLQLAAAAFFLAVGFVRYFAAVTLAERRPLLPRAIRDAPVYTVLVPLRHEAHMLRQIVAGLDRLDWPRERLDIKLVIDADDTATLSVARAVAAEPPYEVIVVPPGGPRTKPMALQYAMTFARGEFVTVYDAEDRPHPRQLQEAFVAFRRGPARLACVQAPLVIENAGGSMLAALFAIEYMALFDGLLPALVRLRLPLPLGGTSNHFRRAALEHVGGWDPFNVTEDADLGIRLARFGYAIDTIVLPTQEEAPVRLATWIRQRTRWQKGWLQTWLVHMRRPVALWRRIGTRQMIGFNALGLGMIVSALAHPFFLATPLLVMLDPVGLWRGGGATLAALAGISIFNLAMGYVAMWTLAARTIAFRGRQWLHAYVWLLPVYWLLMGLACLLAILELALRPHSWNKTPHVGRGRVAAPRPPRRPEVGEPPARVARRG